MNNATGACALIDHDTDDDEQSRAERGAAIDEVLMRLVQRVLQEVQEARAVQESGEPQDLAAPLDHMIDVLDDLIDARRDLDRLYAEVHAAAEVHGATGATRPEPIA